MSRTPPPPPPRSLLYAWRELEYGFALCCRRRRVVLGDDGEDLDDHADNERWLWIQRPTPSSYEIPGGWAYPEAEVPAGQNIGVPLVNDNIIAPGTIMHNHPPIRQARRDHPPGFSPAESLVANPKVERWCRFVYKFCLWDDTVRFASAFLNIVKERLARREGMNQHTPWQLLRAMIASHDRDQLVVRAPFVPGQGHFANPADSDHVARQLMSSYGQLETIHPLGGERDVDPSAQRRTRPTPLARFMPGTQESLWPLPTVEPARPAIQNSASSSQHPADAGNAAAAVRSAADMGGSAPVDPQPDPAPTVNTSPASGASAPDPVHAVLDQLNARRHRRGGRKWTHNNSGVVATENSAQSQGGLRRRQGHASSQGGTAASSAAAAPGLSDWRVDRLGLSVPEGTAPPSLPPSQQMVFEADGRCHGISRRTNERCRISIHDKSGRFPAARPLRAGGRYCAWHMDQESPPLSANEDPPSPPPVRQTPEWL